MPDLEALRLGGRVPLEDRDLLEVDVDVVPTRSFLRAAWWGCLLLDSHAGLQRELGGGPSAFNGGVFVIEEGASFLAITI